MKFLPEDAVERLLDPKEAVEVVEEVFRCKPESVMPPKAIVDLGDGDFRTMPAYCPDLDVAGVKIVNSHPKDPRAPRPPRRHGRPRPPRSRDRPTHLHHGRHHPHRPPHRRRLRRRHLATKHLTDDVRTIGIVGTGVQGRYQTLVHAEVFPVERVLAHDVSSEALEDSRRWVERELGLDVTELNEPTFDRADVIITCTPGRETVLNADDVPERCLINAVGADAPEKRELDDRLLLNATIVVDDRDQCAEAGEVSDLVRDGRLDKDDLIELAEIVRGEAEVHDDLVIFDTTGIALADVAVGAHVAEKAERLDVGIEIEPFELPWTEHARE